MKQCVSLRYMELVEKKKSKNKGNNVTIKKMRDKEVWEMKMKEREGLDIVQLRHLTYWMNIKSI